MVAVRLLIVDDHDFFRRSLLLPLEMEERIGIVGTATSGDQAVTLTRTLQPDVVLMDLNMPYLSGLAAMERITPRDAAPAILVLTGADDGDSVLRALAAGARGYLRKDSITDELLISAIFTVASGGIFLDAKTFSLLRASLPPSQPALIEERQRLSQLSPDDVELLRLVALGFDNDQIGLQLQVAPKTISNRLSHLYLRLGVPNRVRAANFALRNGIVALQETR
ncbi:MAG: response regulator transcription factor [Caldilineaceae bacterium]|nr:response regulator transcription factor [Caldilineaceae bacterium]